MDVLCVLHIPIPLLLILYHNNNDTLHFKCYMALKQGGRAPEYLANDERVLNIVKAFFSANKAVASICHGQLILAAAGVLSGKSVTCYPACAPAVEAASAVFVSPDPIDMCVTDGNLVTGAAWPGHPQFIAQFAKLLGTTVTL
jgi:D-lactate dehydratase